MVRRSLFALLGENRLVSTALVFLLRRAGRGEAGGVQEQPVDSLLHQTTNHHTDTFIAKMILVMMIQLTIQSW